MFIYLLYKNKTRLWKNIDDKSQKFRVFGLGVVFYTTLHFLLFSDYVDGSSLLGQMRKYIFILFTLDLLFVYYLDQVEGGSSNKISDQTPEHIPEQIPYNIPHRSYHTKQQNRSEYEPEETVKEYDTYDFNFTDTEPTVKFEPNFSQDLISIASSIPVYEAPSLPIYRKNNVPIYRP